MRLNASRTAAYASKSSSSSASPFSSRCLNSTVLPRELVVGERLEVGLERRDVGGLLAQPLQPPALADAQDLLEGAELGHVARVAAGRSVGREASTRPQSAAQQRTDRTSSRSPSRRCASRDVRRRTAPTPSARARGRSPNSGLPSTSERLRRRPGRSASSSSPSDSGELEHLDPARGHRPDLAVAADGLGAVGRPRARRSSASASGARSLALVVDRSASRPGARRTRTSSPSTPAPRPSRPRPTRAGARTPWIARDAPAPAVRRDRLGNPLGRRSSVRPRARAAGAALSPAGRVPTSSAAARSGRSRRPAAVDDVHVARFGVAEDEEVVADELELEHGLLGAHRLDRELLRLDDLRLRPPRGCASTASGGTPSRRGSWRCASRGSA